MTDTGNTLTRTEEDGEPRYAYSGNGADRHAVNRILAADEAAVQLRALGYTEAQATELVRVALDLVVRLATVTPPATCRCAKGAP